MKVVTNRRIRALYCIVVSLTVMTIGQLRLSGLAGSQKQPIGIEDIVCYTRIRNIRLSPDGKWIAYLVINPQIADNRYRSTLLLQRAEPHAPSVELDQFYTTADQTFDKNTTAMKGFGGQFLWSADSHQLVYATRVNGMVQLRLHRLDNGADFKVAGDFPNAESVRWAGGNTVIEFKVSSDIENSKPPSRLADPAIRITDDANFGIPPWYSATSLTKTAHTYRYNISSRELTEAKDKDQSDNQFVKEDAKWPTKSTGSKYFTVSSALSPDKKKSMFSLMGGYNTREVEKAYRDSFIGVRMVGENTPPKEFLHTPYFISHTQWKGDSKEIYAILQNPNNSVVVAITVESGEVRELLSMDHYLADTGWNTDGTIFVTVRQSSLMPDELVKVNLPGRKIEVLASPNAAFAEKELPEVRFMRISNPLGGGIFGRLVLPNGYIKGKRYPLIFTTYRAGTGFLEGAVGDEFPILPFAANGFAVFAMDTGISNMVSDSGDLEFTLMRLRRPLDAMQVVRRQLTEEGIIDPERCAITGLSYGSDIVAHAVANTRIFKAASVSISGLDPIGYQLNSVNREKVLETYGYPYPEGAELEQWKKSSIALNAAKVVTPLLIQSPDSEAMFSLETFKALRHYGVPVEWYVYCGEGHVKSQPLNKYYVYRQNLDWMKFWLKDEVTSDPDKQEQYSRWRMMRESFRRRQLAAEKEN
jgi:dipeptidyl aminopeptidase/acylaminoacyl peptidase